MFGRNSEFVAQLDLPSPTLFEIYVGTGFVCENTVGGREIRWCSTASSWRLLPPASGLHLGFFPLFGALVGGEVALALPDTIPNELNL